MLGQTENFIGTTVTCVIVNREPERDPRDPSRDLWEDHAAWWIDGFTDGAEVDASTDPLDETDFPGLDESAGSPD